jgi:hypothetical protein
MGFTPSSPYRSRLIMEFLSGNSEALERLVVEMYARGLSTRDDTAGEFSGANAQ